MLAAVIRSGVVEAVHDGAVAVVDSRGTLVAHSGDIDRPFLGRSAFKPFQAQVGLESGSDLSRAHLAITCASHPATPTHVELVRDVLARADLSETDLRTPLSYPSSVSALQYVGPHDDPRRIWHNCSGKHAGMLTACRAAGFDTASYHRPEHPLQVAIAEVLDEVTGENHGPPAIDGCGVPAHLSTVRGMARAFATLAVDERFRTVRTAMQQHPRLVGDPTWIDVHVMVWVNAVAKGGAEAVVGIGLPAGYGIAIKAWDGAQRGVYPAAVETLRLLGFLDDRAADAAALPVLGGGRPVGRVEARLDLAWA